VQGLGRSASAGRQLFWRGNPQLCCSLHQNGQSDAETKDTAGLRLKGEVQRLADGSSLSTHVGVRSDVCSVCLSLSRDRSSEKMWESKTPRNSERLDTDLKILEWMLRGYCMEKYGLPGCRLE
jgi:hypothetical protein